MGLNTQKFDPIVDRVIDGHDKKQKIHDWVGIIDHHTGQGGRRNISDSLWKRLHHNIADWLAKKDGVYASAHFQIGHEGEITQIVNPQYYIAYHAGRSSFWHPVHRAWKKYWNQYAIGIEWLGDGNIQPFSKKQYEKGAKLHAILMKKFPTIQPICITGHEVISPGRKSDPGKHFDWRLLFELIYKR